MFQHELTLVSVLQEQAKVRMMKQKGSDQTDIFWNNLWGKPKDFQGSGIEYENTNGFCSFNY